MRCDFVVPRVYLVCKFLDNKLVVLKVVICLSITKISSCYGTKRTRQPHLAII